MEKIMDNSNPEDLIDNEVYGEEIDIEGVAMEWTDCPYCQYRFAVQTKYLDEVDYVVHCPMCCMEVIF
jgi:hypothetical protein